MDPEGRKAASLPENQQAPQFTYSWGPRSLPLRMNLGCGLASPRPAGHQKRMLLRKAQPDREHPQPPAQETPWAAQPRLSEITP